MANRFAAFACGLSSGAPDVPTPARAAPAEQPSPAEAGPCARTGRAGRPGATGSRRQAADSNRGADPCSLSGAPSAAALVVAAAATPRRAKDTKKRRQGSDQRRGEDYEGPGVPEKLGSGQPLRLIIVGHNPSEASWKAGHVYAHPGNWMWKILIKTGIAPPGTRGCEDDDRMPAVCGVGFTDLGTGHPGTESAAFSSSVLLQWKDEFYARLRQHLALTSAAIGCSCGKCGAPALVAFSNKRVFGELLSAGGHGSNGGGRGKAAGKKQPLSFGVQEARPEGWPLPPSTEVWVCTSTSGAAPMTAAEREAPYAALAQRLQQIPWPRTVVLACRDPAQQAG